MFEILRSIRGNRRLLRDFVRRDLKARYVGSSMGFFWSVVFPIINLFIYSFVFRIVLRMRWDDAMPTEEVLLLMFAGILVWVSFAESVSRITNSLAENANLIQKVVFPSEVLAPYLTVSSVVNMSLGLPVVIAGVAWFGYINPARVDPSAPPPLIDYSQVVGQPGGDERGAEARDAGPSHETAELEAPEPQGAEPQDGDGKGAGEAAQEVGLKDPMIPGVSRAAEDHGFQPPVRTLSFGIGLLALPLLVILQGVFTIGLGYLLSTLNLFLRDTYHLVGVFLTVWMFSTPIFYPAALVEARGYGWILVANPMHWLIEGYRDVLLYGAWPDWGGLGLFALSAVLVFTLGATFFRAQRDRFPDLL